MNCACGSSQTFEKCCQLYISGKEHAPTAEALMRSRYTAYTLADVSYLKKTLAPESATDFNEAETKKWATQSKWKGLKVLSTEAGQPTDKKGMVEFMVTYTTQNGETLEHHEYSDFRKTDKGQWLFVDGKAHTHKEGEGHHDHHPKPQTIVREAPKVGRNDPCSCGSGKKFKKCCGANA